MRRLFTSESVTEGHPDKIAEQIKRWRSGTLLRPIYQQTAAYGHFGRELPYLTWEPPDRAADLKSAAGA